ncbi:hypothetical protein Emed_005664 [Eimeria media]
MGSSKLKPRCGCLALAVWFLLHLQQEYSLVAFAGDSNEEVLGSSVRTDEENLADVRIQEFQQVADEAAVLEATERLSGNVDREDGDLGAADEDASGATSETMLEGDRARMIRNANRVFGVVAGVVLLATIVRILAINGKAAFQDSASRLRKLQALTPTAETLSVAVDTPESESLWAAVKALLPEIDQTLGLAEAKLTKPGFFFFGRYGRQYRDLMNRVQSNVGKLTEAIAALHTHALDQLEVMAKSIPGLKSRRFAALEDELGQALGSDYAKAFVTFFESREAQTDQILRATSSVIDQSNKVPMFANEGDKASLIATIHNIDEMRRLLRAHNLMQRQMETLEESCNQALTFTFRVDLMAAAHEYKLLFKGMSIFLEQPELQGEAGQLIRRNVETGEEFRDEYFQRLWTKSTKDLSIEERLDVYAMLRQFTERLAELSTLPEKQVIPEGQGDDRLRLQKEVHKLMKEAADYVGVVSQQAQDAMNRMQREVEARTTPFCPNLMSFYERSMEMLCADTHDNAKLCREIADQLDGDAASESLFDTLRKGLSKGSKVSKMYTRMLAEQGYVDLLRLIEADVGRSLDVLNGVNVDNMDPESNRTKLIIRAKDEVAQELANLKEAVALRRIAEVAASINQVASSAAFAEYAETVLQLEDEVKAAGLKFGNTSKK